MTYQVYLDPELKKCMELMQRSGKKASLAAGKAEEIIARLQTSGLSPQLAGTRSRHGEARIRGVIKYDLGSGYRLITIRRKNRCYLVYAGNHDDCHRWIENNREIDLNQVRRRCVKLPTQENSFSPGETENQFLKLAEEENEIPLIHVAEEDLRRIFSGLVGDAP